HLRNSWQDVDALRDFGRAVAIEFAVGQRIASQGDIHYRLVVRICFRKRGRTWQVGGKLSLGALNRRLHITRSAIDAFAQVELDGDVRAPLRARARDQADAGNLRECFLQRRRDRVRHRHRISAWIGRSNGDDRVIDRRQIIYRELIVTEDAEDEDRNRQQHGHYGPLDERARKAGGELREVLCGAAKSLTW